MIEIPFIWKASHIKTIDGDTIDVKVDVGFRSTRTERLRLFGINCPEMKGSTHEYGLKAKQFTEDWIASSLVPDEDWHLVIQTFKSDVFGRYLAKVWKRKDYTNSGIDMQMDLSYALLSSGLAVPFKG